MKRGVLQLLLSLLALSAAAEEADLEVIQRIRAAAFDNSKVMQHMALLSDLHGPRLAGSPQYLVAAEAVVAAMRAEGIHTNIEISGEFGRSWSYDSIHLQMLSPQATTLTALPMAHTAGTDGPLRANVVMAPVEPGGGDATVYDNLLSYAAHIEAYKKEYAGKLAGKAVLYHWPNDIAVPEAAQASRYDEAALADIAAAEPAIDLPPVAWPVWQFPDDPEVNKRSWEALPIEIQEEYYDRRLLISNRLSEFFVAEGVAAILKVSELAYGGAIATDGYGSYFPDTVITPPTAVLPPEQYNRIVRLVAGGTAVEIELDIDATLHAERVGLYNVIATLPGLGKSDEVVILGAHLDSWIGGTGASDNAAGCAVVMEAMRILKVLGLPLERTVRMALWDGEELGYYGSRAYVRAHFGNPVTQELKPEHATFSAYYNVDNGAGRIRGVYLQENEAARAVFEDWLAPFADLGASTVSIRNTVETDHQAFDAVGLPGFQFIQDPLEYESRTHHTNLDTLEHVLPADLQQAAAILAAIAYHTANRPGLMPRKAPPQPLPDWQELPELIR